MTLPLTAEWCSITKGLVRKIVNVKSLVFKLKIFIAKSISKLADTILTRLSIIFVFRLGAGIGDQVCMTGVVHRIAVKYPDQTILVATTLPELYINNGDVAKVFSVKSWQINIWKILRFISLKGNSKRIQYFENFGHSSDNDILKYAAINRPGMHMTNVLSENFSFDGDKKSIKPYLVISETERKKLISKIGLVEHDFYIIHSEGKTTWTSHKEWSPKKFQKLVDGLPILLFQVGTLDNHALSGVRDLRGELTIRELCVLFSICRGVFCQEGLYHHLAAAFDKQALTIYTFLDPNYSAYDTTIPITAHSILECAPCFNASFCKVGQLLCSIKISAEYVIRIAKEHKML